MTHLQLAVAAIIIGLLVAIGWGVWRVLRHTSLVASIIVRNIQENQDDAEDLDDEPQPVSAPQVEAEEGAKPLGFGVRLRERN